MLSLLFVVRAVVVVVINNCYVVVIVIVVVGVVRCGVAVANVCVIIIYVGRAYSVCAAYVNIISV